MLVFTISCKKDKDTDLVTTQTIHGQVYNLCTDSGLENVTVNLNINNSGGSSSLNTISNSNGDFSFSNVQINSNSKYTYNLEVASVSGIGGASYAINGANIEIDKESLNQFFSLKVAPHANNWRLYLPASITAAIYNDTFTLTLQQKTLHKNDPSITTYSLTEVIAPCPPPPAPINFIDNMGNYWMGWWETKLDKTSNGIHTIKIDSFYVGWSTVGVDTLPWQ